MVFVAKRYGLTEGKLRAGAYRTLNGFSDFERSWQVQYTCELQGCIADHVADVAMSPTGNETFCLASMSDHLYSSCSCKVAPCKCADCLHRIMTPHRVTRSMPSCCMPL